MLQEIRHTLRNLLRRPGFTASVVTTLGVALAATIAVFALIDAALIEPLPFPDADRIMVVWNRVGPSPRVRQTELMHLHYRETNRAFESMALAEPMSVTYDDGDRSVRLRAARATAPIFDVLGLEPSLGRAFRHEDGLPGAGPVVLLAHGFWERAFGSDLAVIGTTLRLDGIAREVVGVLPGVAFPEEATDLWVPMVIDPADPVPFDFLHTGYGRLAAGVGRDAAVRDMERVNRELTTRYPQYFTPDVERGGNISPTILSLRDSLVGDVRPALWLALGAAAAILLLATANVANLTLARFEGRRHELAVRAALGASRRRVVGNLLGESCLLAMAGGVLGLGLAAALLRGFVRFAPDALPRMSGIGIDGSVVGFAAALALGVGALLGLAPLARTRESSAALAVGAAARTTGGIGVARLRGALVVAQVALSLVLLVSAGLLVRTAWSMAAVDPGFVTDDVVGLRLALLDSTYPDRAATGELHRQLLERIVDLPGVISAAATSALPLKDRRISNIWEIEEMPRQPGQLPNILATKVISEGYFATFGIPLRSGRVFDRDDMRRAAGDGTPPGAVAVGRPAAGNPDGGPGFDRTGPATRERDRPVVVNEAFARQFWPADDPIGKRLLHGGPDGPVHTIVGVVGSVRDGDLTQPPGPIVYAPLYAGLSTSNSLRESSVAVKARDIASVANAVRIAIRELDPGVAVFDVRQMHEVLADAAARARFVGAVLAGAAAAGMLLGAVGLYGLLSFVVRQRSRELGVRLALGAEPADVYRLVVRQAAVLAGIGIIVGLLGAGGVARMLAANLFGVAPLDPATFAGVTALLAGAAWLAARVPAARAARTDPVEALRAEP